MTKRSFTEIGILILRVTVGLTMLIAHGWGKTLNLFSGEEITFPDPFGIGDTASLALAVFAEVICSALLVLGWKTRWVLIPLIITMAIAFFDIHWNDEFGRMEKSMLYGIAYVVIWLTGPGKYSIDGK